MNQQELESMLIDYIDNNLSASDKATVEEELKHNAEARRMYEELRDLLRVMDRARAIEPNSTLKTAFTEMLEKESREGKTRVVHLNPWVYRAAAAVALILLGVSIGFWTNNYFDQQRRLAEIEKEMETTRQELESTKMAMLSMLANPQSASQRMQGVHVARRIEKADNEITSALLKAMHEDPNTNVRLAALDALSKFVGDDHVKKELIHSLSIQKDPIVQIALIQLLVNIREKSVVNDLQRLVDDAGTMKVVKDEAYSGILKLS